MKAISDLDPETAGHFKTLEARIREGDGQGIGARWAFGKAVLAERVGMQLPKGRLDQIAKAAGVGRAEVAARAKLAGRYPTEHELSDAIRNFPTWCEMVHDGLPVKKIKKPIPTADELAAREQEQLKEDAERLALLKAHKIPFNQTTEYDIDLLQKDQEEEKRKIEESKRPLIEERQLHYDNFSQRIKNFLRKVEGISSVASAIKFSPQERRDILTDLDKIKQVLDEVAQVLLAAEKQAA